MFTDVEDEEDGQGWVDWAAVAAQTAGEAAAECELKLFPPTEPHARHRYPRRDNAHHRDRHTRCATCECDPTAQSASTPHMCRVNCSPQLTRTTHCTACAHFCIPYTQQACHDFS